MTVYILVHHCQKPLHMFWSDSGATRLVGDLGKAFMMISLAEDDRDALRFLWFDNPFSDKPKIIVLRFACVAFGLSSSPFLLHATLKHHIMMYESEDPDLCRDFFNLLTLMTLFLETVMTLVLTSCTLKPNQD